MAGKLPHYKTGEAVMALWPGSKLSYLAKIIKNSGGKGKYEVQFEDGTRHKMDASGITSISAYKSESTRRRSPGRSTKPAASKQSPNRGQRTTRSRSRSTGRTPKPSTSKVSHSRSRSQSPNKLAQKVKANKTESSKQAVEKQISSSSRNQKILLTEWSGATTEDVVENSVVHVMEEHNQPEMSSTLNSKGDLHNRSLKTSDYIAPAARASARIAALQTARVAGIVTPELISDSDNMIKKQKLARAVERHFGGVIGTFLLILLLPVLVLGLNLMCNEDSCTITKLPIIPLELSAYFDLTASIIYLGWIMFQAILYALPIGRLVEGESLIDGTRLKYRINGFFSFVLSMATLICLLHYYDGAASIIHSKLLPMLVTSIIFTFVLALLLFVKSHWTRPYALAPHGNTGNGIYDFFMGRELNPRFFHNFDIKLFLELRPGVIGWAAMNVCFLFKDFNDNGTLSHSLALSAFCQLLYVTDALLFEESLLSTMDITTEGLGYMLVFGDLTFVPFIFTLESRFLLEQRHDLPWYCLAGILLLHLIGHFVFRASNLQKSMFRCNRFHQSVSDLETIPTGLPKEILAGGWWGWLRHPNYFGDLLMALAWCLPCGFDGLLPYTYLIYLFIILCHRSIRDDGFCRRKYGSAWEEYCRRVRHRIFPKLF